MKVRNLYTVNVDLAFYDIFGFDEESTNSEEKDKEATKPSAATLTSVTTVKRKDMQ